MISVERSIFLLSLLPMGSAFVLSARSATKMAGTTCTHSARALRAAATMVSIPDQNLETLEKQGWVEVPNFLTEDVVRSMRKDVQVLRSEGKFKQAGIGQDSTNTVDTQIRRAETCFLFPKLTADAGIGAGAREDVVYKMLRDLSARLPATLDDKLNECLYAYYPTGGYYRRHVDAVPNSASILRKYSYLMYLNDDWKPGDGGELRVHLDQGKDEFVASPQCPEPAFIDVEPRAGTLVLFKSEAIPHEVLDTAKERLALVGWFNRPVNAADVSALGGSDLLGGARGIALVVAAGLVTYGLIGIAAKIGS